MNALKYNQKVHTGETRHLITWTVIFRFTAVLPEGHITGELSKNGSLRGMHQLQNPTKPMTRWEMQPNPALPEGTGAKGSWHRDTPIVNVWMLYNEHTKKKAQDAYSAHQSVGSRKCGRIVSDITRWYQHLVHRSASGMPSWCQ